MHSIDRDGDPTWRATSSRGGTQPRSVASTFVLLTLVFCRVWRGVVLTLLVPYCVCVVDR